MNPQRQKCALSSPHDPEPSSSRKKLNMKPEFESAADDALHESMDTMVFETYPPTLEPSTVPFATFLLATIVSTSTIPLNQSYERNPNAAALLKAYPDLLLTLRSAWSKGSFKEIREMRMCWLFRSFFETFRR